MIHINNLHKRFGDSHVLRGISCDIKPQEVVCIIGPSGSGKSTFLRCMNALETVSEGEVVVNGFAAHDRTTDLNKMRESVGSSATAPCGTASATAFVCSPSSIVIFIRCCFPLLIIYFLINHLKLFP